MKNVLLCFIVCFASISVANGQSRPNCQWHNDTPRTNSPAYHMRHFPRFQYVAPPTIQYNYSYSPIYQIRPPVQLYSIPSYAPTNTYGLPYGFYRSYHPVFGVRF